MTVEWCLPPKLLPMWGREALVSDLEKIHGNLTRKGHALRVVSRLQVGDLELVAVCDELLNHLYRDSFVVAVEEIPEYIPG